MKVGFLGLGWIGRHRLQAAATVAGVEVAALADPDPQARRQALEIAPEARECHDLGELMAAGVEAVVIATPSAAHAEQTIACLQAGLPVFCQKPLARNGPEAERVVEAARRADLRLGVDLCYRHVRAFQELRRLLEQRQLGHVFALKMIFHNAYGPGKEWFFRKDLSGGGCLIDLGTHLFDLAYWLWSPSLPLRVSCHTLCRGRACPPGGVEDYASGTLLLGEDRILDFACSWNLHAGQEAVIEASLFGTEGGARVSNVGGSYYDFLLERFDGTSRQILVEPPDEWGGRAITAYLRRLMQSRRYDPEVEDSLVLARTLDWLYACGQAVPA
jgi:predicted dehydrogenase